MVMCKPCASMNTLQIHPEEPEILGLMVQWWKHEYSIIEWQKHVQKPGKCLDSLSGSINLELEAKIFFSWSSFPFYVCYVWRLITLESDC